MQIIYLKHLETRIQDSLMDRKFKKNIIDLN